MPAIAYAPPYPLAERLGLVGFWLPGRLEYVSSTTVKLACDGGDRVRNPLTGQVVDISGEPTATYSGSGLSNVTLYQAYLNCTTAALDLVATAATATRGVPHKTGDTSSLHVGAVYTRGSGFMSGLADRLVCSLYNPRDRTLALNGSDESGITADGTWRALSGSGMELRVLVHPWHGVTYALNHFTSHGTATKETRSGLDVGLTGTPVSYGWGVRSSGSTSYMVSSHPTAFSAPTGSFRYEATKPLVWGESSGTFNVVGGSANRIQAMAKG